MYSGGGIEPDRRLDGPIEGFNPSTLRPHALRATAVRQLTRSASRPTGDTRPGAAGKDREFVGADFDGRSTAMVADFKKFVGDTGLKIDEAALDGGSAVHQGDDPVRHRPGAVRREQRPGGTCSTTDPQAQFAVEPVQGGGAADAAVAGQVGPAESVTCAARPT